MIVYNEKEMKTEYCLSDDMLIVINSPVSLSEIFEALQRGETLDPERVNIQAFMNGDGKVRLSNEHMPDNAPNGAGNILTEERLTDLEEYMVQQEGYG